MKRSVVVALAMAAMGVLSPSAKAAPVIDWKLGQFGAEPRFPCVKWAKPWPRSKICIGTRTEFLQHRFRLVVDGPAPDEVIRRVLQEAAAAAAGAAAGVGVAAPSPVPGVSVGVAVAAAKFAFVSYLASRGFERLTTSYDVRIDHDTFWS